MKKMSLVLGAFLLSVGAYANTPDIRVICQAHPYYFHIERVQGLPSIFEVMKSGQIIYRGSPIFTELPDNNVMFSGSTYDYIVKFNLKTRTGTYNRVYGDNLTRPLNCVNLVKPI